MLDSLMQSSLGCRLIQRTQDNTCPFLSIFKTGCSQTNPEKRIWCYMFHVPFTMMAQWCTCSSIKLISSQNDFKLVWLVASFISVWW